MPIAFIPQRLTSYGRLELLRRYVRRIELPRRLQAACAGLGGDYGGARLVLPCYSWHCRTSALAGWSTCGPWWGIPS